jgi:hypothetical protein
MNPAVWLVSRCLTDRAGPWNERLSQSRDKVEESQRFAAPVFVGGNDDGEYICRVAAASEWVRFVEDARCFYRIGNAGSLNWNMEHSERGLDALTLSLELSIRHLRTLEDSPRTRAACLKLLQTFTQYFYGSDERLFDRLNTLAAELGDRLAPPGPGWKYYCVEKLAGPRATKRVMNNWRTAKQLAQRRVDLCFARLTR